jgi:transcription termination factor Rho
VLHPLSVVESMEFLSSKLVNFKDNAQFLDMMDKM